MSQVPPEMKDRILDLALAITNAVLADDEVLAMAHYQQLLAYHDEMHAAGSSHPFLVETLADHTQDDREALRIYQRALKMSHEWGPSEPTQEILVGMARRWMVLGNGEQAEACLRDAYAEALSRGDTETVKEIDELRKEGR